jgi:hypothetical protein
VAWIFLEISRKNARGQNGANLFTGGACAFAAHTPRRRQIDFMLVVGIIA